MSHANSQLVEQELLLVQFQINVQIQHTSAFLSRKKSFDFILRNEKESFFFKTNFSDFFQFQNVRSNDKDSSVSFLICSNFVFFLFL
jgi:hypothetical protein